MTKSIKKLLNPIYLMLLLILAGLLVACDGGTGYDDTTPSSTALLPTLNFAGKVQDSDAFIGFALNGAQVMAYICDSQNVAEWLDGQWNGDNLNLTSESGVELQATKGQEAIHGTIKLNNGQALNFDAPVVGDRAGIFRNEEVQDGQLLVTGWVILPDGQEKGARTSNTARQGGNRLRLPSRRGAPTPPSVTRGPIGSTGLPTRCISCILTPLTGDTSGRTLGPAPTVKTATQPARVTATPAPVRVTVTPVRVRATATPSKEIADRTRPAGNGAPTPTPAKEIADRTRPAGDPNAPTPECPRCIPGGVAGLPTLQADPSGRTLGPTPTTTGKSSR